MDGDYDAIGWDDGTRNEDPALSVISDFLARYAIDSQTASHLLWMITLRASCAG